MYSIYAPNTIIQIKKGHFKDVNPRKKRKCIYIYIFKKKGIIEMVRSRNYTTYVRDFESRQQFLSLLFFMLFIGMFIWLILLELSKNNQQADISTLNGDLGELNNTNAQLAATKIQVMELQICKNKTALDNVGAIVTTFTNFIRPVASNNIEFQDPPIWDDLMFWNASQPDRLTVPSDGRYAIGINIFRINIQFTLSPGEQHAATHMLISASKVDVNGMFQPVNPIFGCRHEIRQTNDPNTNLFLKLNMYCETELLKNESISVYYTFPFDGFVVFNGVTYVPPIIQPTIIQHIATFSVRRLGDII